MIFYPLHTDIKPPGQFNNPFYYEPHPLCVMAAEDLQRRIAEKAEWRDEISLGKMFGVLVVKDEAGETGYLAAYSGQIGGRSDWDGFVPAVFDYLQPDGYFKTHEQEISDINAKVTELETSAEREKAIRELDDAKKEAENAIEDYRLHMAEAKKRRDELRGETSDEKQGESDETGNSDKNPCGADRKDVEAALIRESQFMKAELRRIKKRYAATVSEKEDALKVLDEDIAKLKAERKQKSDALQNWLFRHFDMLNARGERRNLISIFADTVQRVPPAGAGECCAPKLLQYAYLHNMRPLCMAEFWWGESPKAEIRHHLHYYPACQGKCKPILAHTLQGLDVEPNPLDAEDEKTLDIIYEDEYLAVVCKPAGMLSVPGKSQRQSVYSIMCERCPDADGPMIVHRLDMATSGLIIVAKTKRVHQLLQAQFKNHEIHKRYVALLSSPCGKVGERGTISLPLRADIMDRPRQMVDYEHGKAAITEYEILEIKDGKTLIALYPKTGRTHQLRVHCAHEDGLGTPIVGDELYGKKADRLYLHAEEIEFVHPITGRKWHLNTHTNEVKLCENEKDI
jgi:tRNA pseudouridine32 synthase/23S rRNA pseudouridine746 synthase